MLHEPVLLTECLHFFEDCKITVFVDGTVGAGGHSQKILNMHPEIECLIAIDQDPSSLHIAREHLKNWEKKAIFIAGNFSDLEDHLRKCAVQEIDGILLDLGVSSMQVDQPERGFSFSKDGPLDMRMDPTKDLTAAVIVNTWSEKELGRVFREFGEVKPWRTAAKCVVQARKKQPITRTGQLVELLQPLLRKGKKKIHPLTLVFQGLRICVNGELDRIENVIPQAINRLRAGGRLAIISFHSLEDRIVKNAFRYAASDKETTTGLGGVFPTKEPQVRVLTKKPITPSIEELKRNPRSRSAKLRVAQKL